jgi:hypothetical protein
MTDHLLSRGRGSRRLPLVNPHTVVLNLNSVLAVFPHAANGPTRLEEDPRFCVGRARPASFRNSQAVNNDEDFISSLSELYLDLFHCHVGLHNLTAGAVGRTSQDRTASTPERTGGEIRNVAGGLAILKHGYPTRHRLEAGRHQQQALPGLNILASMLGGLPKIRSSFRQY